MTNNKTYQTYLQHSTTNPELATALSQLTTEEQRQDHFATYLSFGTGGIRGKLGIGPNRMNVYTVRRVASAVGQYIQSLGASASAAGVVIGYDARQFSPEFAQEIFATLAYYDVRAFVFGEFATTPEVSFATRYYKATMGIMITASHNPPEYNGIKIYGNDGCQLPPLAANSLVEIMNTLPCELELPTTEVNSESIVKVSEDCTRAYEASVNEIGYEKQQLAPISVVYTALNGVGTKRICSMLDALDYVDYTLVKEQIIPDGHFTHTKSANPEEPIAFTEAIALAHTHAADCIIATDPDADRLGVGVLNTEGTYTLLTGNELGALLTHYIIERTAHVQNRAIVKSVVSTTLADRIAEASNVPMVHTLPGFKYIGEMIGTWETTGEHTFILGFEESYGYLIAPFCRDKDSIQAALVTCEMVSFYKSQNLTLDDVLQQLKKTYGFTKEKIMNIVFDGHVGAEQMKQFMNTLRSNAPMQLADETVVSWTDCLLGQRYDLRTNTTTQTEWPSENMLIFETNEQSTIIVRPSGTEPKLKIYMNLVGDSDLAVVNKLDKFEATLKQTLGLME